MWFKRFTFFVRKMSGKIPAVYSGDWCPTRNFLEKVVEQPPSLFCFATYVYVVVWWVFIVFLVFVNKRYFP